jgi:XTP/dITP diphosphohydrolase
MPSEIFLASANGHKIEEFQTLFARELPQIKLTTLRDYPQLAQKIAEVGLTYQENAYLKAAAYASLLTVPVLADDSGVEVPALPGVLGVHSHRWQPGTDAERVQALLTKLKDQTDRRLIYRAILCYLAPGLPAQYFTGTLTGQAALTAQGEGDFGYDPIMIPDGYEQTLSQLEQTVKNKISHRAQAVVALRDYLLTNL